MPPASPSATRVVDVDVDGHTVLVAYEPHRLALGFTFGDLEDLGDLHLARACALLVTSWDLEDDDGNLIPITETALEQIPAPILRHVLRAVYADGGER